jgi:hypothetical protein
MIEGAAWLRLPRRFILYSAALYRLLKDSLDVKTQVELAFRPASNFVFDPEPALAGGSNCVPGFFSSLRHAVKRHDHARP